MGGLLCLLDSRLGACRVGGLGVCTLGGLGVCTLGGLGVYTLGGLVFLSLVLVKGGVGDPAICEVVVCC